MNNILSLDAFDKALSKKGWTLKQLADEYDQKYQNIDGTSVYGTLKNWRRRDCNPTLKLLVRVCDLLECDVDFLLGRVKEHTHAAAFIKTETGLSEDAINRLQECNKRNLAQRELFILNMLLSEHFELFSIIADYLLFPDNLLSKLRLNTISGNLETEDHFVFDTGELLVEQKGHNIPIDSKILRNAMLNVVTEELIKLKAQYTVERDSDSKQTILKAPDTH